MEPAVNPSLHAARPCDETLIITHQLLTASAEQLNTFATKCEDKLLAMHHKMLRLESGVKLLESKLGSIPAVAGAATVSVAVPASDPPPPPPASAADAANGAPAVPSAPADAVPATVPEAPAVPEAPEEPPAPKRKVKDDPRFAKYCKMAYVGVPKPVVAMKFQQETGLDPSILDDPEAPAPPGGPDDDAEE